MRPPRGAPQALPGTGSQSGCYDNWRDRVCFAYDLWREGAQVKMEYRRLMIPPPDHGFQLAYQDIEQESLRGGAHFPLLASGTRRWNAALSALVDGVLMVVAISTDGDITCWWKDVVGTAPRIRAATFVADSDRERTDPVPHEIPLERVSQSTPPPNP